MNIEPCNSEGNSCSEPIYDSLIFCFIVRRGNDYGEGLFNDGSTRVVRMIRIHALLLFDAPSTFMTHLLSWSAYSVVLGMKSVMKLACTWPLIDVLDSYLSLRT